MQKIEIELMNSASQLSQFTTVLSTKFESKISIDVGIIGIFLSFFFYRGGHDIPDICFEKYDIAGLWNHHFLR